MSACIGEREFLFILGAPKCGTTSLSAWLSEHPGICFSAIKEPHFFNTDMQYRVVKEWRRYEKLFKPQNSSQILAEASTWYLYSREAVKNIERALHQPKYIVLVRDPADMVVSLHQQNLKTLNEDCSDLEKVWCLQEERRQGRGLPPRCEEPEFVQYREACALGSMLERLYADIPEHRVLLIHLDELKSHPRQAYLEVLEFLGLQDDGRSKFDVRNEAALPKNIFLQQLITQLYRIKIKLGITRSFGIAERNLKKKKLHHSEDFINEVIRKELYDEHLKLYKSLAVSEK